MQSDIPVISATVPCQEPPAWALWERRLIDAMNDAVYPFLEKYTHPDGTLIWADVWSNSRDGADDLYESCYNWPLLYLLGGGDHLLTLGQKEWDAITRQLTALGPVYKEYERGYDQFHQAESYIYFYLLCMADPKNPVNLDRARRFAGLYLNEDPDAPNYDPERKLIRAAHNGSGGPRWGISDQNPPAYGWAAGMRQYGLPFHDVPGITHYDDLKDPALARRMGQVMHERMGQGDVAGNLMATSLAANAYLMTGDDKYRRWIVEYVEGWVRRAEENGGLLPDNVGLSGQVGEYMNGRWYGGLYGWAWPHGYYNIGMAATVAGSNAYIMTRDPRYLELPRSQYDFVMKLGEVRDFREEEMSLSQHWLDQFAALKERSTLFLVPYRHSDFGWFDYQPMAPTYPTAIWALTLADEDWSRIEQLRKLEDLEWNSVLSFHGKEDAGHEKPWLRFLAGENPAYPEEILRAAYHQVCRRLAMVREDEADLTRVSIHHWQQRNPITTEALIQLTLGAPQLIYNGGLLHCQIRYFDAQHRRPGLPQDVAALVESVAQDEVVVQLINLNPQHGRSVIIQAGGFGEHRFTDVGYARLTSDYPGAGTTYAAPPIKTAPAQMTVNGSLLTINMDPGSQIRLRLGMERFVNAPSYSQPWD